MSLLPVKSSGLLAAGTTTISIPTSGPAYFLGVTLLPGSAASSVYVYDAATAVSTTEVGAALGVANGQSVGDQQNYPVPCNSGSITVVVAGTGAKAIVYYSLA